MRFGQADWLNEFPGYRQWPDQWFGIANKGGIDIASIHHKTRIQRLGLPGDVG
jgi:hypothetical protein